MPISGRESAEACPNTNDGPYAAEFGVITFGELSTTGSAYGSRLPRIVDLAKKAELKQLDFFGIGEHHRADFAVSAPEIVLAAISALTKSIRLTSAVTVLSADDPIRVIERFGLLDELSGGRAEIMIGRGAYRETFELFGIAPEESSREFVDRAERLLGIRSTAHVLPPDDHRRLVTPKPRSDLPIWVGAGGAGTSVLLAAQWGLPLMLVGRTGAVDPIEHALAEYSRESKSHGRRPGRAGVSLQGYVAETDAEAREQFWFHYSSTLAALSRDRGWAGAVDREAYERELDDGLLLVGSPATVARKLHVLTHDLGLSRVAIKCGLPTTTREEDEKTVELYAAAVRELRIGSGQTSTH
ncbi:LLM class flavin-dependent oxidoreductase [Humibacter ginsenosidimutans]|uniref:LLM class flavin-dependent oxidoreductase n=1 Tax=Humibacter ginsenosidimutans TaxID=2599293 RepID=UPI00143D1DF2|nr:LLM class flavin-dependent oxidoreductase [Humibacter ginsenosidimutans]